jgi:hypothetical protein
MTLNLDRCNLQMPILFSVPFECIYSKFENMKPENSSHISFTTIAYVHIRVAFDWFYHRKICKKGRVFLFVPKEMVL